VMRESWANGILEDMLDYIQPSNYIVDSTKYDDSYKTPVLTAGKSFIKGYTNENRNIFKNIPVIIFDDFTTATQFVNFQFKVKSSAMKILTSTSDLVILKYVFYFMQTIRHNTDTHKRYWISIFSQLPIKIAPPPEQRAIVAKIEQLTSSLDNGIANLKATKDKLEIYRQAVLKKAFEGELTKEWREKQADLPSADELLAEIAEKRCAWIRVESEKGNQEARRIKSKLRKTKTIIPKNEIIPDGWKWSAFIHSCHIVVDCHNKTAPYEKAGIYLVRTTNIRNGKLNLVDGIRYVSEKTYKYWSRRCFSEPGDILFTREAPMGEAAIIPANTKLCMGQRLMLLRTFPQLLHPKYLLFNILSSTFQQRFINSAIGTGVKHLRVGDVEKLVIPLCSSQEQIQIVKEIETRLSVCDNILANIKEALVKSEALHQSILKKAFEGKLLSEAELEACRREPDWEPAEKLLERIMKEKKVKKSKGKNAA
jgi:type I restriction enzyme, S subunit